MLVRSDSVGSCSVACDPSQTTVVFCADATWTLDSKSSGSTSGGAYNLRWGGRGACCRPRPRAMARSAARSASGRLTKGADSGNETKAPIAFGAPGPRR